MGTVTGGAAIKGKLRREEQSEGLPSRRHRRSRQNLVPQLPLVALLVDRAEVDSVEPEGSRDVGRGDGALVAGDEDLAVSIRGALDGAQFDVNLVVGGAVAGR